MQSAANSPGPVPLDRGIHLMHLFYSVDRGRWAGMPSGESARVREALASFCAAHAAACQPRVTSYVNLGGKADLAFILYEADAVALGRMHRRLEGLFPPGVLRRDYQFLSVTELSEYMTSEEETRQMLVRQEKLDPESAAFQERMEAAKRKLAEYAQYRLYPEMPDWEVMGFYPMNKRRQGGDNWYMLDFASRKKLMGGHARVGRKYAGRVSQLITGCTGLDDWEWGVTLMAHRLDALKEIVYEMRFDEVSARYGEFGEFYINLRMDAAGMWEHLGL